MSYKPAPKRSDSASRRRTLTAMGTGETAPAAASSSVTIRHGWRALTAARRLSETQTALAGREAWGRGAEIPVRCRRRSPGGVPWPATREGDAPRASRRGTSTAESGLDRPRSHPRNLAATAVTRHHEADILSDSPLLDSTIQHHADRPDLTRNAELVGSIPTLGSLESPTRWACPLAAAPSTPRVSATLSAIRCHRCPLQPSV